MRRLAMAVIPPPAAEGPLARMRWVRRMEICSALMSIIGALALWSMGAWHWVLLGAGVLGLSPWPGPGAIVRRAQTRPEILNYDVERGRRRSRAVLQVLVPLQSIAFGVVGYLTLGVGGAIFMLLMGLAAGALGVW